MMPGRIPWALVALICTAMLGRVWAQHWQVPEEGLQSINAAKVLNYAGYFAADRMRGRDTPSAELDSCAAFIAHKLRAAGWVVEMQPFNLLRVRLGEPNCFVLAVDGKNVVYRLRKDFSPAHVSHSAEVQGGVAFVGYGITAPEYGYDDYASIDVRGKIVLLFAHEPQEHDSSSVFDGARETVHSSVLQKVENARLHGAVGVLLVTDPLHHRFERPAHEWLPDSQGAPLVLEEREPIPLVVMRVGKRLAEDLASPGGKTLSQLQAAIDSTLVPQSFLVPQVEVRMRATLVYTRYATQNLIGVWEGADPVLRHETVVVGAHYDHIGARGDTLIFPGADDNASGTAALLAIAEALASAGGRPKRTVVCVAFAGEEKGLFGSRYYVANPRFPLSTTVAMLNMDMIGCNDTAGVKIEGCAHAPELQAVVERANAFEGLALHFSEKKVPAGSDAMPFHWRGVRAVNFTTGLHADYHKPTDTVDKLTGEHLAQVARLVFAVTWLLANEELPPRAEKDFGLRGDEATGHAPGQKP
ncbi:MAG: M20/M25/M40 family metallo-hydrolase [candidate division KSB1 bacterium]|nr:M20/M25/M40 family metallo-hydrolase [candidate division KSB1 bacterium]